MMLDYVCIIAVIAVRLVHPKAQQIAIDPACLDSCLQAVQIHQPMIHTQG